MIGIIPAGGKAERMGGIPKMLLPIPTASGGAALMDVLMDRMEAAGPSEIVIGANHERSRLAGRYGKRARFPLWQTETMSEMVMRAPNPKKDKPSALFGMPDTFFEDEQAFPKLLRALDKGYDVAVGVFVARPGQHREGGMCKVRYSYITEVIDKPDTPVSRYIWGVLAWQPTFWEHMDAADPHVGYAIPRAIAAGLKVRAVLMQGGFWDCGTPERYFALIRHLTNETKSESIPV